MPSEVLRKDKQPDDLTWAEKREIKPYAPQPVVRDLIEHQRLALESMIIGEFDTRRGAELAVENVVQEECGVSETTCSFSRRAAPTRPERARPAPIRKPRPKREAMRS
jgi:hypothetical protein